MNEVTKDTYFLDSLGTEQEEPPWRIGLVIVGREVSFKIDTGADVSVISKKEWNKMSPRPKIHASSAKLDSPGGPVQNLGQFIAHTDRKGKHISFRVFVLKGETDCLLSRGAAMKLGLVKRLDDLKYLAFGDIGTPVKCEPIRIELKEDAEPYSILVARRVPIPLLPKVEHVFHCLTSS